VRRAWLQCTAGASGDMLLGALLDAGARLETVQQAVDGLGLDPVLVSAEQVTRQGVAATKVNTKVARSTVIRTWGNIRSILRDADLAEPVRVRALDVLSRLARAESTAHRVAPESVHFHEAGALDALAYVLGACAALHELEIGHATCSPVALGSGMTRGEHGLLPVPGPAVLSLLEEAGAPVYSGDVPYELCTRTGAALLASLCDSWGEMPLLRVTASGAGAGSRDYDELPNVLRVVIGEPLGAGAAVDAADRRPGWAQPAADAGLLVEAGVAGLDPATWPGLAARLAVAGGSDSWLTPTVGPDGLPAHTLSVLLPVAAAADVYEVLRSVARAGSVRTWPVATP
jgi:pyridinium-3,5-bisthiocarboxylic acid mononucleotide nickel chelatase